MATASSIIRTPKTSSKASESNQRTKVRVVVRVRSFLPFEILKKSGHPISCVSVLNPEWVSEGEVAVYIKDQETSRKECYKLDAFFGQDSSVTQIFQKEVSPFIPRLFHGCNSTVFAYGATGSGKTHTMQGNDEFPGVMLLAMSTILSLCETSQSFAEISYYEVYMDRCYDLLEPKTKEISVLDDKDGQVQLKGLSRVPVNSMSEFYQIFSLGIQRRKVAHTGLNDVSSRSHGVLVISVSTPSSDVSTHFVTGKLNLIDLAGNEDNRRTCNEGIRLQESAKINQSLFALSNVIHALNNNKGRVPYRESKLTRILQDSLGGSSLALMVACLNPGEYQESLNTVSLASRSRQITNYISSAQKEDTPKVKVDMEAKLRAWLESKGKNKGAQRSGAFASPAASKTPFSTKTIKKQNLCSAFAKTNTATDQGLGYADARNLFNAEAVIPSSEEETCLNISEEGCSEFSEDQGCTTERKEVPPCLENHFISPENSVEDQFVSRDADENISTDERSSNHGIGLPCEEDPFNSNNMNGFDEAKEVKQDKVNNILVSGTNLSDESLNEEKTKCCTPSKNVMDSPTISEKMKVLQQSLRKVLSPINPNSNMRVFEDHPPKDQMCVVFFEPKTPKTPYILTCDGEGFPTNTPLDKFNSRSSNLKNSLVQEYLTFLNSASKEELLRIKGIGHKRADSIIQLREMTPLTSLYDLEKIGLSTKQVNDIFRTTARGIFD